MGLFDKKYCSVCGEKIGLLGNRKLEDGNLCKDCASKLSHWFEERKHSTVDRIKDQLAYREANLEKVKAFHTTKSLGGSTIVCFDEDARRFLVQRTNNVLSENPDVLAYSDVTGVDVVVTDIRTEEKFTQDGKQISFVPPRYLFKYTFTVTIRVTNPYFNEMRFDLNGSPVVVESIGAGRPNPRRSPEYVRYDMMAMDIKKAFAVAQTSEAESKKPKTAVRCPHCEATTIPDASGRCEYCGGAIQ